MSSASAPASTANLGPGFDCLAVALDLRCTVHAAAAETWSVESEGRRLDGSAADAVAAAARYFAGDGALAITIESEIPVARGLGSSAALRAASVLAGARAVAETVSVDEIFAATAALEGHAEQAAAAVYGGAVAVLGDRVAALDVDPQLRMVVAIPDLEVATPDARRVLPSAVAHDAAARSIARTVFLVEGLRRGDQHLLAAAAGDEIHEPFRFEMAPEAAELIAAARSSGAWHAALSGAGSAVVALTSAAEMETVAGAWHRLGVSVLTPDLSPDGVA